MVELRRFAHVDDADGLHKMVRGKGGFIGDEVDEGLKVPVLVLVGHLYPDLNDLLPGAFTEGIVRQ